MGKYICTACEKKYCIDCSNRWSCDCECNKGGTSDIAQKTLASFLGIGMAVGGIALTVASGGLAIPIGGALLG